MIFIFNVEIHFICTAGVFCLKQFLFIAVYTSINSTFLLQYYFVKLFLKVLSLMGHRKMLPSQTEKGSNQRGKYQSSYHHF